MNSINKKEIKKFSNMAAEWWDPEGKFAPFFLIRQVVSNKEKNSLGLVSCSKLAQKQVEKRNLVFEKKTTKIWKVFSFHFYFLSLSIIPVITPPKDIPTEKQSFGDQKELKTETIDASHQIRPLSTPIRARYELRNETGVLALEPFPATINTLERDGEKKQFAKSGKVSDRFREVSF